MIDGEAAILAIPIRRGKMERVWQMPDFTDSSVGQQHLDDIKPKLHLLLLEQFQIIEAALRKKPPLARIYGSGRAHPIF